MLGAALTQPERALEMRVFWTRLRRVTLDAVEELRPDVVLIGHDMSMAWADDLPADLPAVLTCHNLTLELVRVSALGWLSPDAPSCCEPRRGATAASWRRGSRAFTPPWRSRPSSATSLSRWALAHVELIPTGVDIEALRPLPESDGPPRVLFTGTMSYPPNREGGAWLAERVWPIVRERLADARLDIVGKDPDSTLAGARRP